MAESIDDYLLDHDGVDWPEALGAWAPKADGPGRPGGVLEGNMAIDRRRAGAAARREVNPSRPFILRPVATSLAMVAILLAGLVAYRLLPISALRSASRAISHASSATVSRSLRRGPATAKAKVVAGCSLRSCRPASSTARGSSWSTT